MGSSHHTDSSETKPLWVCVCMCMCLHTLAVACAPMHSFRHGRYFSNHVCPSVCVCVWRLWELQHDRDGCNTHVSLPTRWQGRAPSEGQTLSSNDRPALNVCVRACTMSAQRVLLREKARTSFVFIYLFSHTSDKPCVLIDGPFVCVCVQVFYVHGRACVCCPVCDEVFIW